jgi:hypothetical protein
VVAVRLAGQRRLSRRGEAGCQFEKSRAPHPWLLLLFQHAPVLSILTDPIAIVGDYDRTRPVEMSVEAHYVDFLAIAVEHTNSSELPSYEFDSLALGVLAAPVTFPGFVPATMNEDPAVPRPHQNLSVVGSVNSTKLIQISRADPMPALMTTMNATDDATCASLSREIKLKSFVEGALLCALPIDDSLPCKGTRLRSERASAK